MNKYETRLNELKNSIAEINEMNSGQQISVLKDMLASMEALYTVGKVNETTINNTILVAVKRVKRT